MSKKTSTLMKMISTPIILSGVVIPLMMTSAIEPNNLIEQTSNPGYISNYNGEFLHSSDDSLEIHSSYYDDYYIKESFPLSDGSILIASYEEEGDDTPWEYGEYGPLSIYNQSKYNNNSHLGSEVPLGFSESHIFTNDIDIKHIISMGIDKFAFVEEYDSLNRQDPIVHYFDYSLVTNSLNPLNEIRAWSVGSIQLPTGLPLLDKKQYEEIIYNGTNLIGISNYENSTETRLIKLTDTNNDGHWTFGESSDDEQIFGTVGGTLMDSNQEILDIKKLPNGDTMVLQEEWSFDSNGILNKKSITSTTISDSYNFSTPLPKPTCILEVLPTNSMYDESLSAEAAIISDDKVLIGINQGKVIEYNPTDGTVSSPEQVLLNSDLTVIERDPTIEIMEVLSNDDVIAYGGNNHFATLNHYDSSTNQWTYKTGPGEMGSYDWNEEVDSDMDSSILEIKELEGEDIVMISGADEGYGLFNMKNNTFEKMMASHDVLDGNQITHITEFTDTANPKNDHYLVMGEEGYFNKLVFNDINGIPEWSVPALNSNLDLKVTNSLDGSTTGSIAIDNGGYEDYFSIMESIEVSIDDKPATDVDSFNPSLSNSFSHIFSYSPTSKTGLFPGEYNIDIILDYETEKSDPTNTTKEVKEFTTLVDIDDPNTPYEVSYNTNVVNGADEDDKPIINITNGSYIERGNGIVSKVEARVIDSNTALDNPDKGWEVVDTTNKTFSHSFEDFDQNDDGYEVQIRLTYNDGTTRVEKTNNTKPTYISSAQVIFPKEEISTGAIIGIVIGSIALIGLTILGGYFFLKSGESDSSKKEVKEVE